MLSKSVRCHVCSTENKLRYVCTLRLLLTEKIKIDYNKNLVTYAIRLISKIEHPIYTIKVTRMQCQVK